MTTSHIEIPSGTIEARSATIRAILSWRDEMLRHHEIWSARANRLPHWAPLAESETEHAD